MAVYAAFLSVIVRNSTIEERFPGGIAAYAKANPGLCTDGMICRIGFMGDYYGELFASLRSHGIRLAEGDPNRDVVLFSHATGLLDGPCSWLRCGLLGRVPIVWLAGSNPKPVAFPRGYPGRFRRLLWRLRTSFLQPVELPDSNHWKDLWKPVSGPE